MSRINIGDINSATFKVGNVDCQLYLGEIKLYPTGQHDYSQDYFTFNVTTGGNIVWSGTSTNTLSYSKDNGQTWATADSGTTISVNTGDKVLWKGTATPQTGSGIGWFSGDTNVRYSVEGNAMSLLFADNFNGQTDLTGKDSALFGLFSGNTNVTRAENLVLPATTLTDYCYQSMFRGCTSLTTAPELPATTLAYSCYQYMFFGCTNLTTAPELPATTLASYCYRFMFQGCTSLTTAPELPATTLASQCYAYMFRNCSSLNYITCLATDINAGSCTSDWVNGVAASGTFVKDASMTDWTVGVNGIPSGWTVVDETYKYKFALTDQSVVKGRCTSSTTLTGDEIFQYKDTLEHAEVGSCVTTLGQNLFKNFTNLKTAVIPNNVTNIVGMTFQGASGLTSVSLPNGLTSIPWYMFQGCKNLTSITIPSGVTSIGEGALNNIGVSAITIPSGVTSMGSSVLRNCSELTSIDIPSGVTNLSNASFMDDVSLEQVTLHEGLVSIGNSAFWNCVSISSITIPDSVTSIDGYVFFNCTNLANINLGSGLTNIGIEAFKNCYNLSSIDIPSGVTNIGNSAFYNCVDLLSITMNSAIPPTIGEATFDNSNECPIYVPAGSVEAYKTAWPTYAHRIQGDSHDYSNDYFTMNITTGGDIVWSGTSTNTLSYSKDNGQTWATADSATTISVNVGDKVLWKGTPTPQSVKGIGRFSGDTAVRYSVEGNAMSLLFADNFNGQTDLTGKDSALFGLFSGNTNVTRAENLVLPATTLASGCYWVMFNACTNLTTAPELPATTLADHCYQSMFQGCTSLTKAPSILPATTLTKECYEIMFGSCTSLTTAPELPATTLADHCYYWMFNGCSSLNYIKCLATDISASSCTNNWVNNVAASGTFVKAASMTGWTTGSDGIPSGWTVEDDVHDYSLDHFTIVSEADNNTISILKNGSAPAITVSASTDDGQTWTTYSTSGTIATLNTGDKLLLKGVNNKWGAALVTKYNKITASASFHVEGNIMSLLYGDDFVDQTSISGRNYVFQCLFDSVTTLTNAKNLILPATTLADHCYGYMFSGCISLTTAPELPATTLANGCYRGMLQGCSSLTKAPELPAPTLTRLCYAWLFNACSSLNYIKCLATDISANNCTNDWVNDVSATGTFVKDPNMSSWTTGIDGIPSGWSVQDAS